MKGTHTIKNGVGETLKGEYLINSLSHASAILGLHRDVSYERMRFLILTMAPQLNVKTTSPISPKENNSSTSFRVTSFIYEQCQTKNVLQIHTKVK